ncbi:50S ribosomal protein L6 [uncultured archaeon]|nr:50S ribosomal protein L6 [uncultured archaeon]
MKRELIKKVEIPEGVEANIVGDKIIVKKGDKVNEREFDFGKMKIEKKGNEIILENKKASKNEKRNINTTASHIRNMIKGIQEKFEYKLKVCFSHFPMTVEVKGNEALIKNFLGERSPRKVKIPAGAEVKVDKEIITVTSSDKEIAGQAAANFENVTRIVNRDRRIFQDGIFITNKCGEEM